LIVESGFSQTLGEINDKILNFWLASGVRLGIASKISRWTATDPAGVVGCRLRVAMYYPAASVPPGTASFWYNAMRVFINHGVAVPANAVYARTDMIECGAFIGHQVANPNAIGPGANILNIPTADLFFGSPNLANIVAMLPATIPIDCHDLYELIQDVFN